MAQNKAKLENGFLITGVIAGWFALIGQFYLIIVQNLIPAGEILLRYFSYFTILTNIIVALCFSFLLFKRNKGSFFTKLTVLTATAVYIAVVGLVYNLVLRTTWKPEGMQLIVDELLHAFIPVLFLLYWFIFVRKKALEWRNLLMWLVYPFLYLLFVLFRGSISGFYPYPFLDVNKLGYSAVFLNCIYMLLLFLVLSVLMIWIGKGFSLKHGSQRTGV